MNVAAESVKLADAVRLKRGVDITQLPLGAQEGFILSRVDGRTVVKDLVASTGLPQDVVLDALKFLLKLGVVHKDYNPTEDAEADAADGPPEVLPQELADEPCDLAADARLRILQVEYETTRGTHYGVLGLKRAASQAEIKQAYRETSREFHPDAFFRKNLGSFKARLEKIFKHVKKAYDVLSDETARREYDKALPPPPAPRPKTPKAPAVPPPPDWRLDPKRVKEAEERRLKRNPMVQRVERAQRHLAKARELLAAKQLAQAANEIGLASAQDPWNEDVRQLQDQINQQVRDDKFAKAVARIELATAAGAGFNPEQEEKELAEAVRSAMEMEGASAAIYVKLGRALIKGGHPKLAKGPADRALKLAPDDDKAIMLTVDLLEDARLFHNAVRLLEKAHQANPSPERAERIQRLRKAADRK
ncbi:MAG: J domain-containing protein [Deltaproteobacteria bacterium]|nr:J domain-containing protein [Deltaproteobacteria bacterium]